MIALLFGYFVAAVSTHDGDYFVVRDDIDAGESAFPASSDSSASPDGQKLKAVAVSRGAPIPFACPLVADARSFRSQRGDRLVRRVFMSTFVTTCLLRVVPGGSTRVLPSVTSGPGSSSWSFPRAVALSLDATHGCPAMCDASINRACVPARMVLSYV